MPCRRSLPVLLAVVLCTAPMIAEKPDAAAAQPPGALSQRVVTYRIDARLDTNKKTIDATELLTYRNLTGKPLQEFPFHLYLNAFQPKATFVQEIARDNPNYKWNEKNAGAIEIKKFEVVGMTGAPGAPAVGAQGWIGDLTAQLKFVEAIAIGVQEALEEDYLRYRIVSTAYLGKHISDEGVPIVQPPGGHAIYLDARAFLPHIPPEQFPGVALGAELYLEGGIRSVEIGSLMFGQAAKMELVRLAIPRRVYTQSHIDYVIEVILEVWRRREQIRGFRLCYEAPFLRHFTAKFERV